MGDRSVLLQNLKTPKPRIKQMIITRLQTEDGRFLLTCRKSLNSYIEHKQFHKFQYKILSL